MPDKKQPDVPIKEPIVDISELLNKPIKSEIVDIFIANPDGVSKKSIKKYNETQPTATTAIRG